MKHNFRIHALHEEEFTHYFEMSDEELQRRDIRRMVVDQKPGFPCRVSLQDAEVGEVVILLPYTHHNVESPYRAAGPIYVRRAAHQAVPDINEIPALLNHRLLSLRAYDRNGMMIEATVTEGKELRESLERLFDDRHIEYIHIHNAKPGCFNCEVRRV